MESSTVSSLESGAAVVEYGAILSDADSKPNEDGTSPATAKDESQAAKTLLENDRTPYSLRCIFEHDAWYDAGKATIGNEVLNLVKNIVGSGGLSLPAGIAAFGNAPSAILPAILVIFVMGIMNAYSFSLLGRVCSVTKSKSYQEAWDRSVGRRHGTKFNVWVGLVVTGKAILGCWSFSIIIASTCQPLLQNLIPDVAKSETLIGITILILLPLCLAENLSSLAGFSIIGQIGTLVTTFTMALRYFDGSYQVGGQYYDDIATDDLQPSFGDKGWLSFFTPQSLILISILSQGYVASLIDSMCFYYFDVCSNVLSAPCFLLRYVAHYK
jgi:amino acid permease